MPLAAYITASIGGFLGASWSITLVLITRSVYQDGEYIDPHWMATYTALVIAGTICGLVGIILGRRRLMVAATAFLAAVGLALLAIAPGYAFSWTGFSGFSLRFFGLFVGVPCVVQVSLYLATTALALKRLKSPR